MIYTELIHGEYMYIVTDRWGRYLAETYSLEQAEQWEQQYRDQPRAEPKLQPGVSADGRRG